MGKRVCSVCGYEYDPAVGDPDNGIAPGTAFEDLPDDWVCPVCGASKEEFEAEDAPQGAAPAPAEKDMSMYQCQTGNCGYIYRPEKGDRKGKIPAGTSFDDLPDDWRCPVCGASKKMFQKLG